MIRLAVLLVTLSLAMPARGAVRGSVLDTSGKPIEGASVAAFSPETSFDAMQRYIERRERLPIAKANTSPAGNFTLEIENGASVVLLATAPSHAPQQQWIITGGEDISFTLERTGSFKGTITADGKPLAEARVVWMGADVTFATTTGADGTYEVPDPKSWAFSALVFHPDYAPQQIHNLGGKSFPAAVALSSGKSIRGVVLHDGKPVAGAIVRTGFLPLAKSGEDGTFSIPHLPPEVTRIQAHAGALVGKAGLSTGPVRVELVSGLTLYGTVRDAKGRPLPGTSIEGYGDEFQLETFTDSKGNFELSGVSSDEYVSATRPGYERIAPSGEDTDPTSNEKRRRLDFAMKPLTMLRGRVIDESGAAVVGASIDYTSASVPLFYGGKHSGGLYSGVDGRFALPGVPRPPDGETFQLEVKKKGYVITRVDVPDVERAAARELTIRLRKGIQISGIVVDEEGHPVPAAGVGALRLDAASDKRMPPESWFDEDDLEYLEPTDTQGRFTLAIDAGEHTVGARAKGMAVVTVKIDVRAGADPITLRLERGLALEGRVLRHDGSPVAGATVQLGDRMSSTSVETDASGRFQVAGLKENVYNVVILHAEERIYDQREVAVPGDPLIVRLARTTTITGHVRSSLDGSPVPRFSISVWSQEEMPLTYSYVPRRDPGEFENAEGTFSIEGLAPGMYSVTARADGFARRDTTIAIDAEAEKPPEPIVISMNPAARFRGRITSGGEPLPNVNVRVSNDYGTDPLYTDPRGEFELNNVAVGPVTLGFEREGYVDKQESVAVRDDDILHEFTMNRASRLTGKVVSDGGEPLERFSISAESQEDDTSDYAWSDETGSFTLRELSSGKQTIKASLAGYADVTLPDVSSSQETPLRIVLKKLATGSVVGTVRGRRAESTMLMISTSSDRSGDSSVTVDESGNYRLDQVPAGTATIELSVMSESASRDIRKNVHVPAGGEARLDFDIDDVRRIDGRVTLDGEPLLNAQVSFEIGDASGGRAQTRAGGAYEAHVNSDGPYTVYVWASQLRGTSFKTSYTVRGSATFDIDIRLRRFAGLVVDAETGEPLPGASVSLVALELPHDGDASTTCDSTGHFVVATAVAGPVRLRASHDGYGQRFAEFTDAGSDNIVLEIPRSVGLAVRLIDARSGKPLGGTVVMRDGEGRYAFNRYLDKTTDGSIRVPVTPGQYTLSVSSSGYSTQSLPVTVPSPEVRIGLTPGGTLVITSPNETIRTGKLIMPNGAEYIRCECNGIAELKVTGSITRIENVAPGAYRLVVSGDGGSSSYPLQITQGGITTIAID
ncbi:MAG: carboxypeptidase regulatory-like domain-containing protein [Thermoanaerobaculia bacterium]